jgi:hypothetical protein
MKHVPWYDLLQPRQAVLAGLLGLAVVWALGAYLHQSGYYTAWGLTRATSKNFGTLAILLGFAVPYWLVRWWVKRR